MHVIRGVEDEYVKSYGHFDLGVYGQGKAEDADYWKSVIRQTLIYQYPGKGYRQHRCASRYRREVQNFLRKPYPIELANDHDFTTEIDEEEESAEKASGQREVL